VELADACPFWLAFDQFLAGGRRFDSEQDPFWRVPGPFWPAHVLASPDDAAVGADDPRGAGEVSPGHAWALRIIWTVRSGAEGVSGKTEMSTDCSRKQLTFAFHSPNIGQPLRAASLGGLKYADRKCRGCR